MQAITDEAGELDVETRLLEQSLKSRIGTERVESRIHSHEADPGRLLFERQVEPPKPFVDIAERTVDHGNVVRRNVSRSRLFVQLLENLSRLLVIARDGMGVTERRNIGWAPAR